MTRSWFIVLRRYFLFFAIANLLWEIAQLPLYTIWRAGSPGEIAFAVAHCTGGDLLIGTSTFLASLLMIGSRHWPSDRYFHVALAAIVLGAFYTMFSEWLNVSVRQSWAYSDLMPRLPGIGTGLSPVAQWIVVPMLSVWWAGRHTRHNDTRR